MSATQVSFEKFQYPLVVDGRDSLRIRTEAGYTISNRGQQKRSGSPAGDLGEGHNQST